MKATLKRINAAIAAEGIPGELVKNVRGGSYFYMADRDDEEGYFWTNAEDSSIYVFALNQAELDWWIETIRDMYKRELSYVDGTYAAALAERYGG